MFRVIYKALLVRKVRTIIVPSMEVQTRIPAVHLIITIQRRQIIIERRTPHRMNCQEEERSARILSPILLSPRALPNVSTASSRVSREISPVGLSENTVSDPGPSQSTTQ